MLKITQDAAMTRSRTLRLEGQVAGEWVRELRAAYADSRQRVDGPLALDLANVTFIDAAGLEFFAEVAADVTLVNCSLFAAEQLKSLGARQEAVR